MKNCPVCHKDYYDETLEFCLDDGSRLQRVGRANNEILTAPVIKPNPDLGQIETIEFEKQSVFQTPESQKKQNLSPKPDAEEKRLLKQNLAQTSLKILETSPIVLALAHNFWQWLYLTKQPTYDLTAFFTSYTFLIWMFLLISSLLFGLFSLKYGKNKGFAITALVVLAINVILSIVPK